MFTAIEILSDEELNVRRKACLAELEKECPGASGILVFSRPSIYYLCGTYAAGVFWLPSEGEPVLAVRKGEERAALESPNLRTILYRSYKDLPAGLESAGSPLGAMLAVEQNGLSWGMGLNFSKNFAGYLLIPGDMVLRRTRSVKTTFELGKMRQAGRAHYKSLSVDLPEWLKPGVSEYDISRKIWDVFFSYGHCGVTRMSAPGQELFLGHVCAGENASYPSYYDGPLGEKGVHVASPYMGCRDSILQEKSMLAVDVSFAYDGYNTDKTQLYFTGSRKDIPDEALRAQACCMDIQAEISARLRPGAIPEELYRESLKIAERQGFADGFMGLGGNRVSFVAHGIGLNVDEWPVLAKKFTEPLRENMVMALEPKITLPGFGMLGVENTFRISPEGGESLTTSSGDLQDDNGDIICLGE